MLEPDLTEIIERALESRLQNLFTADVGVVQTYDPAARTVDVIPVAHRSVPVDDEGTLEAEIEPIRPNVPVCFPRGGGVAIEWPILPGDFVLVVTLTRGVGPWRATGTQVPDASVDQGLHHPGNCVAFPCLRPDVTLLAGTPAPGVLDGLVITSSTIKLGSSLAINFAALANKVDANFARLVTAIQSAAPVSGDGGAAFRADLLAALAPAGTDPFEATACTKVKVE